VTRRPVDLTDIRSCVRRRREVGTVPGEQYEIRVDGTIPPDELTEFEGLSATVEPVASVVRGSLSEPGALPALLARLRDLGLEVVEVRLLPRGPEGGPRQARTRR
jgi:hypothetical protein